MKPVKALNDSKTAASKIWECVEKLGRMVAPEPVAAKPEAAPANPKRGKKAKAGLAFESPGGPSTVFKDLHAYPRPKRATWAQVGHKFLSPRPILNAGLPEQIQTVEAWIEQGANGQIPWQTRANWRP